MNRNDYHPNAHFIAQREFRNGWHMVPGYVRDLRIGDRVLINGKWHAVTW